MSALWLWLLICAVMGVDAWLIDRRWSAEDAVDAVDDFRP